MKIRAEMLHEILTEHGPMEASRLIPRFKKAHPDIAADQTETQLYNNIQARLRYGTNKGVFHRVKRPGRVTVYMANDNWNSTNYGRRGGQIKFEERARIIRLREIAELTWEEIAQETGKSVASVHGMYQRAKAGEEREEETSPEKSYTVLG